MKKLTRILLPTILLAALAFFWWVMFGIVWPYTSGETDLDFLQSKQHIIHLRPYRWSFYLHIFSSLFVLAAGLTQFSGNILQKIPTLHRWVGKIYVAIVLFFSGPAALVMSWYANGGSVAKASFITLSILWWWCTWQGWQFIQNGNVQEHGRWMIRSYALTFSAITLRLMQFGLATFTEISPEMAYKFVAWPSWVLNLAVAEIILAATPWLAWVYGKNHKSYFLKK